MTRVASLLRHQHRLLLATAASPRDRHLLFFFFLLLLILLLRDALVELRREIAMDRFLLFARGRDGCCCGGGGGGGLLFFLRGGRPPPRRVPRGRGGASLVVEPPRRGGRHRRLRSRGARLNGDARAHVESPRLVRGRRDNRAARRGRRLREIRLGGPRQQLMESHYHFAQRSLHLHQVDAVQVAGVALRQRHRLLEVAKAQLGSFRLHQHPEEIVVRHAVAEGAVHLQERGEERVGTRARRSLVLVPPARLRLLRGLEPELGDDRRAERSDLLPPLRLGGELHPTRHVALVLVVAMRDVIGEPRHPRHLHARGASLGLHGDDLEQYVAVEHAARPVAGLIHVQVRLPRARADVRQKRGKVIRRQRRVAIVEAMPTLGLPVHEPSSEGCLDVVGGTHATGELAHLRRERANRRLALVPLHPVELVPHHWIHPPVSRASLDVLRGTSLEGVPVGGHHHRRVRVDQRGGVLSGGGLRRAARRARRGGRHAAGSRRQRGERVAGFLRLRAEISGPGPGTHLAENRGGGLRVDGVVVVGGDHPRGELGDESAQAGVFASGGTRALFLRVWQRRVVFLILRVGNLGVFRRRRGELVLLLAAASGVGRLGHLGPAAEALFQPPVRHDALQARLVRLGPLRALELVAHQVGGLTVEHAHVLGSETLDDRDELGAAVSRVSGEADTHVGHVREAVERGDGEMEDAVVDGNQRARLDARLDPGPGDDTLAVARRAAVHLVVGASGRAHARGLEHDVGHRRGVVLGRHAAALAPDGLEQLADLLRLGSVVILLDVMERQTRHEGVGGLVRLQRGVEGRHREGRHDEEGERVVVSSALQITCTPLGGSRLGRAVRDWAPRGRFAAARLVRG